MPRDCLSGPEEAIDVWPRGGCWLQDEAFMSKCLEVLTGGRSMAGKCLRDVALGQLAGCEMGLTLESAEGEVPHLRWSQAPPLPWPRPGSAEMAGF